VPRRRPWRAQGRGVAKPAVKRVRKVAVAKRTEPKSGEKRKTDAAPARRKYRKTTRDAFAGSRLGVPTFRSAILA